MIKWENPVLISLNGATEARGDCNPTGSGDSGMCYDGNSAGADCFDGSSAAVECDTGTAAISECDGGNSGR